MIKGWLVANSQYTLSFHVSSMTAVGKLRFSARQANSRPSSEALGVSLTIEVDTLPPCEVWEKDEIQWVKKAKLNALYLNLHVVSTTALKN